MAGFIQGRSCILKVNVLGDYLPLICAKSFTLTVNSGTVETTTQGTGPWKTFDYDDLSYTISFDGVGKAIDSNPIVFDIIDAQTGFVEVGFQAFYIDNNNVIQKIQGVLIITQTTLNAIANDTLGFGIEFQGTGEFTRTRLNNPKNLRIIVTGTAQGTAKFRLINSSSDVVYDSGTLNNATDITVQVDSGNYYYYIESDSAANDNDVDVNTPVPIHHDYNGDPFTATSYPTTLYDFTADRTVTFEMGLATAIVWSFDEQGSANGTISIYKNGVLEVIRIVDSNGNFIASGGDTIRIVMIGTFSKTLVVVDTNTSTTIINTTTVGSIDESFIATSLHTFTITATTTS